MLCINPLDYSDAEDHRPLRLECPYCGAELPAETDSNFTIVLDAKRLTLPAWENCPGCGQIVIADEAIAVLA